MSENVKFVKEKAISEHLFCTICSELFKDPLHLHCGHVFCSHCITEWLSHKRDCPECRVVVKRKFIHKDMILTKLVGEIQVRCDFRYCRWTGALEERGRHVSECRMNPIKTPQWLYTSQKELKNAKKAKSDEAEQVTEITKEAEEGDGAEGKEGDDGGGAGDEEPPPLPLRLRLYQSEEQRERLASLIAPPPSDE